MSDLKPDGPDPDPPVPQEATIEERLCRCSMCGAQWGACHCERGAKALTAGFVIVAIGGIIAVICVVVSWFL